MKIKNSKKNIKAPLKGWSTVLHFALNAALPIALLLMIRADLVELSIVLALFSKWRVFAVKPRHLPANLRSNATDVIVKLSTLSFIIQAESTSVQIAWTAWYVLWLTLIKPQSSKLWMSFQALAGQSLGLTAIFFYADSMSLPVLLAAVWIIAISSARHFIGSYDETWSRAISYLWALFVTQLAWITYKWLLVYIIVPQITLVTMAVGYTAASIYNEVKTEGKRKGFIAQQLIMVSVILFVLLFVADWKGSL